jgi:signal transduction histidine kinase
MILLGAQSWGDAVRDKPLETIVTTLLLIAAAVAGGVLLRPVTRRTRSLHHLVLAITIASLAIGALAALLLARLMVLDAAEARVVISVLAITAIFASILAIVAAAPLGHDAARLAAALRRLEDGDRSAHTGVQRADELGHIARALDALTAQLDRLERERTKMEAERRTMLTSISHDLRTPLAALQAAIEALVDGIAPDPPRYLRSMQHDVVALSALVDDLFLLTRLESGQMALVTDHVDLSELAEEAVEALQPAAAARSLDVRLDSSGAVPVDGNASAIGRVIRNLLDNAIRHAPEGSVVAVSVDGHGVPTVRVVDEGDGFSLAFADEAFNQFTRADPSRTRLNGGGAGLGLAIARRLVEAHGGHIYIDPPPGGRVTFQLPAR